MCCLSVGEPAVWWVQLLFPLNIPRFICFSQEKCIESGGCISQGRTTKPSASAGFFRVAGLQKEYYFWCVLPAKHGDIILELYWIYTHSYGFIWINGELRQLCKNFLNETKWSSDLPSDMVAKSHLLSGEFFPVEIPSGFYGIPSNQNKSNKSEGVSWFHGMRECKFSRFTRFLCEWKIFLKQQQMRASQLVIMIWMKVGTQSDSSLMCDLKHGVKPRNTQQEFFFWIKEFFHFFYLRTSSNQSVGRIPRKVVGDISWSNNLYKKDLISHYACLYIHI